MLAAAEVTDTARSAAAWLVQRQEQQTGSRMVAYENVASMVGASSEWIRRFVGRRPDVRPDLVIGLNILATYHRMCARVEQEEKNERSKEAALQERIDEIAKSALELVARLPRPAPEGKDAAAASAARLTD